MGDEHQDQPSKQKRFWSYIKSLKNTGIAPLKDNERLFNTAIDKANIVNRQYQSVFTKENSDDTPKPSDKQYPQMPEITVTTEGVRKLLNRCNPSKACGPGKIPARILRESADVLATLLCIVFNASIQSDTVPELRLETSKRNSNI